MFKKSADLIHLHDRTGSHATKGFATGRLDIPSPEDFMSPANIAERVREIRELGAKKRAINDAVKEAQPILEKAIASGDRDLVKSLRKAIGRAIGEAIKLSKQQKELRRHVPMETHLSPPTETEAQKAIKEQDRADRKRAKKIRRRAARLARLLTE